MTPLPLPSPSPLPLPSASPAANVLGLPPESLTAWATVALAFVGFVSIIANVVLAIAAMRSANAAKKSAAAAVEGVNLQRDELALLGDQLEMSRQQQAISQAKDRQERERLVRDAEVNLTMELGGGLRNEGMPSRELQLTFVLENHGPGTASRLEFGVRYVDREMVIGRVPTFGPGRRQETGAVVGNEVISGLERPIDQLIYWVVYEDAVARRWKLSTQGFNTPRLEQIAGPASESSTSA